MLAASRCFFFSFRHLINRFSPLLFPVATTRGFTNTTSGYRSLAGKKNRPARFGRLRAELSVGTSTPDNKEEEHHSSVGDIPSSPYQWVKVYCSRDVADALSEALLCFGASSASMDELSCEESTEICITSIFTEGRDVPKCISVAADSIGCKKLPSYEITTGEEYDWTKNESFHPNEVTKGLWIVPQWRKPQDNQAINVMLNPGMAFGTGEHPTTKLCLLLLHGLVKGGESFLDYGTGSGILAIAAVKMGASLSVGVDVDPQAISSAEQNIALNEIRPDKVQLYLLSDKVTPVPLNGKTFRREDAPSLTKLKLSDNRGKFDIVIANILLNPLIELADDITSYAKPGAIIGLSGILAEQIPQVKEHYLQHLDAISISELDGWACLSGMKKETETI